MLNKRLLPAWALGLPISYIALGFLDAYYTSVFEIILVSFFVSTLVSLSVHFALLRLIRKLKTRRVDAVLAMLTGGAVLTFFISLIMMASRFPRQFDITIYHLSIETWIGFMIGVLISLPAAMWSVPAARRANLQQTRLYKFVNKNLGGLVIAALFFSIYFLLASIFNQPIFNFDDIFFDTDSRLYRFRFGTELYKDYYERTVHPYVLIIVRPWVGLVSLFLKGDMLYGAFIVTALTGALCVFLVWYFVKESSSNRLYALLIAALFGASASQLAFGSLIENYIFLAATALIFMVLLLKNSPMYALVIAGAAAFGITISNIAQTVIAHFMVKRNIPQLIKYGLIVGALIIPLNLLNNVIYPGAHPYLWDVGTLQFEEKNVFEPTFQRANFLGRVMLLHSFVSPDPLMLKEDIPFLKLWMFRAALKKAPLQIARYETDLGNALVVVWLGFVAIGGLLFLKNLFKQDNRFPFAFILITLFSFALHMRYGRDVFLYSANWTYAITLFLALAWRELSGRRWFQVSLLAFVALLMVNNSRLILLMLWASWMHIR
jgi:hypothetical protein